MFGDVYRGPCDEISCKAALFGTSSNDHSVCLSSSEVVSLMDDQMKWKGYGPIDYIKVHAFHKIRKANWLLLILLSGLGFLILLIVSLAFCIQ